MNILGRALGDRRAVLTWWSVGVVVYCGFIIAVWPVIDGNDEFADMYADMPEALQAMFGSDGFTDFASPTGFLNTYLYSMILPFIFAALAISLGASLVAGEEEDGLLDLVLSYPVGRRRMLLEKVGALLVAVVGIGVITTVFLALAREPVALDVGLAGLAAATLGSVLFAAVHGLVALLAGAVTGRKGVANGAGWGVALAGYLASILATLDEGLEWLRWVSPLAWATTDSPITGTVPGTYLALVGAFVVLVAAALVVFDRHDLT